MSAKSEPKVFENKKPKLTAFILSFTKAMILLLVLILFSTMKSFGKPVTEQFIVTSLVLLGIAVIIAAAMGIAAAVKAKKIIVKVTSDDVDVTVDTAHGVYPVKDYEGTNKRTVNNGRQTVGELVFADEEGEEGDKLFVGLPGISGSLFTEISDAITIAKHAKSGDEECEPWDGDEFTGPATKPWGKNPAKVFLSLLIFEVVMCAFLFAVFTFFKIKVSTGMMIFFSIFFGVTAIACIVLAIMTPRFNKLSQAKQITKLKLDQYSLKINEEEFRYSDIKSVTMTPPYLKDVNNNVRILTLTLNNVKDQKIFYLMPRPAQGEDEILVCDGYTCEYPALYARFKTDPGTAGIFEE